MAFSTASFKPVDPSINECPCAPEPPRKVRCNRSRCTSPAATLSAVCAFHRDLRNGPTCSVAGCDRDVRPDVGGETDGLCIDHADASVLRRMASVDSTNTQLRAMGILELKNDRPVSDSPPARQTPLKVNTQASLSPGEASIPRARSSGDGKAAASPSAPATNQLATTSVEASPRRVTEKSHASPSAPATNQAATTLVEASPRRIMENRHACPRTSVMNQAATTSAGASPRRVVEKIHASAASHSSPKATGRHSTENKSPSSPSEGHPTTEPVLNPHIRKPTMARRGGRSSGSSYRLIVAPTADGALDEIPATPQRNGENKSPIQPTSDVTKDSNAGNTIPRQPQRPPITAKRTPTFSSATRKSIETRLSLDSPLPSPTNSAPDVEKSDTFHGANAGREHPGHETTESSGNRQKSTPTPRGSSQRNSPSVAREQLPEASPVGSSKITLPSPEIADEDHVRQQSKPYGPAPQANNPRKPSPASRIGSIGLFPRPFSIPSSQEPLSKTPSPLLPPRLQQRSPVRVSPKLQASTDTQGTKRPREQDDDTPNDEPAKLVSSTTPPAGSAGIEHRRKRRREEPKRRNIIMSDSDDSTKNEDGVAMDDGKDSDSEDMGPVEIMELPKDKPTIFLVADKKDASPRPHFSFIHPSTKTAPLKLSSRPTGPSRPPLTERQFDKLIYEQAEAQLPPPLGAILSTSPTDMTIPFPFRFDNPNAFTNGRLYLHGDPRITWTNPRSPEWTQSKRTEISQRPGRKDGASFGSPEERLRRQRQDERARELEAEERLRQGLSVLPRDPKPAKYSRPMDFGDVPEDELPDYVKADPNWVRACKWMRECRAKRIERMRTITRMRERGEDVSHMVKPREKQQTYRGPSTSEAWRATRE